MTPEQKNTITNHFRVSGLEDRNADINNKRYPDNPGGEPVFIARSAYDVIDTTPPPVDLWHGLWYQGEMACLFGEPNVGKTILAMKIASDIVARGESVLYFDFENAEHQLLPRYAEHSEDDPNSPRFTILTPNYFNHDLPKSNRDLLPHILKTAVDSCINVVIIDDITHLFGTGDPADVRHVLNIMRSWVKQHRLSVLVLAHARRRKPLQPITLEHLAGSFECAYSFDSIFSLNRANRHYRRDLGISAYIKQHKSRMGEVIYDDENVITASLRFDETSRSLTFCNFMIDGNERQLLRDFGYHSREEILQAVLQYKDRSFTICEIAERVGISKSQVGRLLKEHYDEDHRPPAPAQRPLPPMTTEPINPHPVCSQTVVDQGGIGTLLVDDDMLPMRRYDPTTGRTYKYYPDLNFSVEIKPDQFINLPPYLPDEDATADSPLTETTVGTGRALSAHTQEPATPANPAEATVGPAPISEGDNHSANPSMMCDSTNAGEETTSSKPFLEEEHQSTSDDDEDDKPWDPCAYEEPVRVDDSPEEE